MELIDQHAWLVNNNLFTDEMKDNIATLGYCIVEDVIEVSTTIDFNSLTVTYNLVVTGDLINNLNLLERYKTKQKVGFFEMRRLRKFLQKKAENDESGMGYELEQIANKFVKGYLNSKWSAKVKLINTKDYDETEDLQLHEERDLLSNE